MFGYYSDTDDKWMWKSGTVASDKEDDCIVLLNFRMITGVRDIFNIVSSTEISVSATFSDPTVAQFYMIGTGRWGSG